MEHKMPCWEYFEFSAYLVTHERPCGFMWVNSQIVPLHSVINIMYSFAMNKNPVEIH